MGSELLNGVGESGREEDVLHADGKHSKQLVSVLLSTNGQWGSLLDTTSLVAESLLANHLVGFIEYQDPDELWVEDIRASQHILDRSRCADQDVLGDSFPWRPGFRYSQSGLDVGELANAVKDDLDLSSQFSGRCEADRLISLAGRTSSVQLTCGAMMVGSILDSMLRAKAAVLPVPD